MHEKDDGFDDDDDDDDGFEEKNLSTPNRSYDPQLRMNDR